MSAGEAAWVATIASALATQKSEEAGRWQQVLSSALLEHEEDLLEVAQKGRERMLARVEQQWQQKLDSAVAAAAQTAHGHQEAAVREALEREREEVHIRETVREKRLMQQEIRQLFSIGQDREATGILVGHIMLVSPSADRQKMLHGRSFDESGKLGYWNLHCCKIGKLSPSFGALVCSGDLDLDDNNLKSVHEGFSDIIVVGHLNLDRNPHLTGVPKNFPNVKTTSQIESGW